MVVREHGCGPAVVLLAGSEPLEDWFALSDVLSRTFRVLLVEPSPRGSLAATTDALASLLANRDALRPSALVGASTGAYMALDLVARAGIATPLVIALAGVATLPGARDLRGDLPQLRARVYARVGALDRACPPVCSDEITRLAPRATLEIVLGCGHALLRDDGPATVAAITRELAAG